jgi:predicted nucleotidyltransferase
MKPSIALEQNRALVREVVARYPTTNPRIFGSVLHGTDKEGSDIDILVDAMPDTTLLHLGGLQEELTEKLGVPVQILTPDDLPIYFRDKVIAEAKAV